MNNYKKLSMKEKEEVFENIWREHSQNKVFNNIYVYIAMAAIILFSIVLISPDESFGDNAKLSAYSEIINYDLYEDKELIFNESLQDMTNEDLENILTQL